jgi:hypothetical protein
MALQEEWVAIPPETLRHLVKSLPGRVRTAIKAKGRPHPVLISTAGKNVTGKVGLQFQVGVQIILIRECIFHPRRYQALLDIEAACVHCVE